MPAAQITESGAAQISRILRSHLQRPRQPEQAALGIAGFAELQAIIESHASDSVFVLPFLGGGFLGGLLELLLQFANLRAGTIGFVGVFSPLGIQARDAVAQLSLVVFGLFPRIVEIFLGAVGVAAGRFLQPPLPDHKAETHQPHHDDKTKQRRHQGTVLPAFRFC